MHRLRRLRRSEELRSLVRETRLTPADFIYPVFVCPGEGVRKPIDSMPGVCNLSIDCLVNECRDAASLGIPGVVLFGIPPAKDADGTGGYDDTGIVQEATRALREAESTGFENAVVLDGLGNVAELATANIWMAKDGAAHTPIANGTFLNGITRQRVGKLLAKAGIPVHERVISPEELLDADEIFSSGNYGKVMPIVRIEGRDLQPGPVYGKARETYMDWAHGG